MLPELLKLRGNRTDDSFLREITAILLIIFYVLVFIANINSSKKKINIFKADYTGPGMNYLYKERIPMQIILIAWTWYFGILN
jgi:uncharacterized membrane protein